MDKWEYKTSILQANIEEKGVNEYLSKRYPDRHIDKFSPAAMEMYLNKLGEAGWEIIHIQPIAGVGDNGDIYWHDAPKYSNAYFCTFKRRKSE